MIDSSPVAFLAFVCSCSRECMASGRRIYQMNASIVSDTSRRLIGTRVLCREQ